MAYATNTGVSMTYTCTCNVVITCAGDKLLEAVVANHIDGKLHKSVLK